MVTKHFIRQFVAWLTVLTPLTALATSVLESFTVKILNVEVRELKESSIQFKTDTNAYSIHLEPKAEGNVIFSLTGISYASTSRFSNLLFSVRVVGFKDDALVNPTFCLDESNKDITIDHNSIVFNRIYGSVPVIFHEEVDSVRLYYSNSLDLNADQYLGIADLRILPPQAIVANPMLKHCGHYDVMIAIDQSASVDKEKRAAIADQLIDFVTHSAGTQDSHQFFVAEFGYGIQPMIESSEKQELVNAFKKYQRQPNGKSNASTWTNWSIVFEEATIRKPDLLVVFIDGWSNWRAQEPGAFTSQYEQLISQCNALKNHHTRLLFITADLDPRESANVILSNLLNNEKTRVLPDGMMQDVNLRDVDLITVEDFSAMTEIHLASLLECHGDTDQVVQQESRVTRNSKRHSVFADQ